jgi:hypothetical protein
MKSNNVTKQELTRSGGTGSSSGESIELLASMMGRLEGKFDELIYAVQNGNDTSKKLLKYSKA